MEGDPRIREQTKKVEVNSAASSAAGARPAESRSAGTGGSSVTSPASSSSSGGWFMWTTPKDPLHDEMQIESQHEALQPAQLPPRTQASQDRSAPTRAKSRPHPIQGLEPYLGPSSSMGQYFQEFYSLQARQRNRTLTVLGTCILATVLLLETEGAPGKPHIFTPVQMRWKAFKRRLGLTSQADKTYFSFSPAPRSPPQPPPPSQ
eukprot:g75629.t1